MKAGKKRHELLFLPTRDTFLLWHLLLLNFTPIPHRLATIPSLCPQKSWPQLLFFSLFPLSPAEFHPEKPPHNFSETSTLSTLSVPEDLDHQLFISPNVPFFRFSGTSLRFFCSPRTSIYAGWMADFCGKPALERYILESRRVAGNPSPREEVAKILVLGTNWVKRRFTANWSLANFMAIFLLDIILLLLHPIPFFDIAFRRVIRFW